MCDLTSHMIVKYIIKILLLLLNLTVAGSITEIRLSETI
ncbi:hypothetical protein J2T03_004175 [Chryseobacterium lathyri]|jgi:hypothetical protein|nr:hypothetical protein [Chryseobacterium lathyri]